MTSLKSATALMHQDKTKLWNELGIYISNVKSLWGNFNGECSILSLSK